MLSFGDTIVISVVLPEANHSFEHKVANTVQRLGSTVQLMELAGRKFEDSLSPFNVAPIVTH